MAISSDFKSFCKELKISEAKMDEFNTTVGDITKKLNSTYYGLVSNASDHMYIVGSVGRGTAIAGVSDLDIIFDLPNETYKKFDGYESNGQSALLQEVKKVLLDRYPKTTIKGDGQVVSIQFNKYTVELVPGFKQSDDSFKFPDSDGGGSWKTTKPLPEIEECKKVADETDGVFIDICNVLRAWKNKQGFKFGGLLIDTLSYNFLNKYTTYKNATYENYLDMIKDLFNYLKDQNKDQVYWYALGSNQQIYNTTQGKFVSKAKKAYNKVKDLEESSKNLNKELRKLFGGKFPKVVTTESKAYNENRGYTFVDREQFISDLFQVDIKYDLNLDCTVTQDGYRPDSLRRMLERYIPLNPNKQLKFEIIGSHAELEGADIYWKIRNVGEIAERKNMLRGEIVRTNCTYQHEHTNFRGEHFVECYVVRNGVCVARSRIDVPITEY